MNTKQLSEDRFFPCTKWIPIGDGIEYRPYKHWGMGCWAGEGLFERRGDRSGCLTDFDISGRRVDHDRPICPTVSKPLVVCARIYRRGEQTLSAVLSYPNGLSITDAYFWEIYPSADGDVACFDDEDAMEAAVREVLHG